MSVLAVLLEWSRDPEFIKRWKAAGGGKLADEVEKVGKIENEKHQ